MDLFSSSKGKNDVSFEDKASVLSKFTMMYMNPLFAKGYEGNLVHEDLGPVSKQDEADVLYQDFMK